MNSQRLNDWLQIVGLFGVIGSLIFVGLQLNQTQAIAESQTYQNRTATIVELNVGAMSSPEFLSGVSKIYVNKLDELTMQEAIALEWWFGTNLAVYENNLLQLHSGFLTPEHWQRNLKELECMLTVPLFSEIATDWPFRESFQKVISEELQKIPADSENCWSHSYGWDFPIQ